MDFSYSGLVGTDFGIRNFQDDLPRIFDGVRRVWPNARVCTLLARVKSGTDSSFRSGVNLGIVKLTCGTGDNSFGPPVIVLTHR